MRAPLRFLGYAVLAFSILLVSGRAAWPASPEAACQVGRRKLAAKYATCRQKAYAKLVKQGDSIAYEYSLGTCVGRFGAAWQKLAQKAIGTGSTCETRFVDNGDGTVDDVATGLQWEQKTDDTTVHDRDNVYSWSMLSGGSTPANGTVFTTFLATLTGGCFAGHCDWRLPTLAELQTITLAPDPCDTSPCIDGIFGPTAPAPYWSSIRELGVPFAWTVRFDSGAVIGVAVSSETSARGVRSFDPLIP
jgi:Protein of unknown function (DUF1566)